MNQIQNPILPGFFPDPSICRVGDDYFIANSSFEWFPGVPIHHSRDLMNWRLIGHVLTRPKQLDLRGVGDSGGVWAPSLSFAGGQFWLVYTNVRQRLSNFKDIRIFLATGPDILGPWSDPLELNSIGFDPSLFHDEDGRKWLLNMIWDFRKDRNRFAGIVIQEYDPKARKLVGPLTNILTKPSLTEGPNLYKRDGWYYLMLAEGGTGWNHSVSMARSRNLFGPYEPDPEGFVVTSRENNKLRLQKAGHGELVQTKAGQWFLAHLASRPVPTHARRHGKSPDESTAAKMHIGHRCILGRETCLQSVQWNKDGWLRLATGGAEPQVKLSAPKGILPAPKPLAPARDDFETEELDAHWSSLRVPAHASWLSLKKRHGWLRLLGRDSLHSLFEQSLIARRVQHFHFRAETSLEFSPAHFTQLAGLVFYYDTRQHYYLRVTHDERLGKVLGIVLTDDGIYDELTDSQICINKWKRIFLRGGMDRARLQFSASSDGKSWRRIGPVLDASKLSDDYGSILRFTGAMVGLCAQDVGGNRTAAYFDYFDYLPRTE